jgi:hypothetical protein
MLSLSFLLHLRQVAALLLDGGKFLYLLLLLQQGCFSKLSLTTLHQPVNLVEFFDGVLHEVIETPKVS